MKLTHYLKESRTYDFVFGILCFMSIFGSSLVNIFLGLSILLYAISFNKIKKQQLISLVKSPFIFLFLFIIYIYTEGLIVGVLHEKRFKLLYLIPFLLILGSNVKSIVRVAIFFVVGNSLLLLFGLYNIIQAYLSNPNFNLKEGSLVNKLLIVERPYLGFTCVLSILILMFLIQKAPKFKKIFLLLILAFAGYIIFISARLALISLIIVLLTYFIGYAKLNWRYKIISFLLIIMSFFGFNFINPTLADRFLIFSEIDFQSEQIKDYEPRVIIWQCASKIIKDDNYNKFFGMVSTEKLSDNLTACYKTDEGNLVRRDFFVKTKFNTHNQYLDLFITTGFFGIILLMLLGLGLLYENHKNFYVIGIVLALGLFLLTENGLSRQMGVYLISTVLVLIYHFRGFVQVNSN